MRAVIQRVRQAEVSIDGGTLAAIGKGLLILLGIEEADGEEDAEWLAARISKLRIFPDQFGVMNLSLIETGGDALIVSQFTLHASTRKGNRPSYIRAAASAKAVPLYEYFIRSFEAALGKKVSTGRFGAMMDVSLVNSGPVTILIDTKNKE
ncbi:MAG TPA: D-aminoacyl-tRNA deacylase [Bacteroidales bacterium]|nr:D-aminoacyl-tRNA deacylase [Bacteroidales bacterium]HSA43394.1 D-aminoacyl-tRNA deacylase [Bacteroidales bacterium]